MLENTEQLNLTEEDTQKDKYLIFAIDEESYGIAIRNVVEIIKFQTITDVPELPDYVKGIINLRGKIIPVIDIRLKFKKAPKEYDDRTSIIVVDVDAVSFGLIVDYVVEVSSIDETDIETPPEMIGHMESDYIEGMGKVDQEVWLFLDCSKLFKKELSLN